MRGKTEEEGWKKERKEGTAERGETIQSRERSEDR